MKEDIWNPINYDANFSYISKYGEELVKWLGPKPNEKICDVGCGTGDLAHKIALSGANVTGVDSSLAMVKYAAKKYKNITYLQRDATALKFTNHFNAVFSNATLHWVKNTELSITSIASALQKGGRFVAELGGAENVKCIVSAINKALEKFSFAENINNNPWTFTSTGKYISLLEKAGFVVNEVFFFKRDAALQGPNGLRNWITMFAPFFFENVPKKIYENMLTFIEEETKNVLYKNNSWTADYTRLKFKATKL